jgi:replication factor A1
MVMEIGIDDGTAHMHATLFGDSASEFLSEDSDTVARTFQEYLDAGYQPKSVGLEYVIEKKPNLMGKEIVVSGSVTENDFSGKVFNVYDIKPLNAEKETELILKELEGGFDE